MSSTPTTTSTTTSTTSAGVRHVVIVRPDAIGDAVLASGMLPHIATAFAGAAITVVCAKASVPMYEHCPLVRRTIAVERDRAYQELEYREGVARELASLGADVVLNTVYSRDPLCDYLAANIPAALRVAHAGDTVNIHPASKAENDRHYSLLVPSEGAWKPELERHADFLRALGINVGRDALTPRVWAAPTDVKAATALFDAHGLEPGKTIALFAGGQFQVRDYPAFGEALAGVCRERGWKVVALGAPREAEINRKNVESLGEPAVDLTGKTAIREAAEIVRLCRLAVGAETSLAHIACAVGTPNVIILGGGHFGRFMPYSPLTTAACLPIECYGCNWVCRFERPHCVKDVSPLVVERAIRAALSDEAPATNPRIVAQDRSMWNPVPGRQPGWNWFHGLLDRSSVDLIAVGRGRGEELVTTPIAVARRHGWQVMTEQSTAPRSTAARDCLQATPQQLPAIFAARAPALIEENVAELSISPDERLFLDEIRSGLARGEADPFAHNYRAAAMFYWRFDELEPWDPTKIPDWMFDPFLKWTLRQPFLFTEIGEAEQYARRFQAWMERMRDQLRVLAAGPLWRRLGEPVTLQANLISAYFSDANLLPLVRARGDIMEMYLRAYGGKLDMDPPPRPGAAGKKIRLGVLKNHWAPGTETYATLPLFEHLPRDRFEVVLFAVEHVGGPAEAHVKSKADRFVMLPATADEQAEVLRKEQCDIVFFAINMNAVTHILVPLACHRVAPVQMTSICSPATSGLPNMDYFLAGELTEPRADAQEEYREKLIKFPGSGICFDYTLRPPPSPNYAMSRQQLNLSDDTIVYTSGANYFKIIPELRRTWARLLKDSPENSVLVLYPFGPAWTNSYPAGLFTYSMQQELAAAGVDPKRLIFLNPMESPTDVRKVMAITDIYVDSFPYTGATSLLDPLEAFVPPVTMCGQRLRFAQGEALMRELGMPELIASSEDDYIRIATEMARDRDLRERRRQQIREKMAAGPAFLDSKRFSANAAEMFERLVKEPS